MIRRFLVVFIAGSILSGSTLTIAGVAGTEQYTYDELGRLVQVNFPDGTRTSYSYDAAGNRTAANPGADVTPPTAPTNLVASAPLSNQVILNWVGSTDVGGSGLAGYRVFRNGGGTAIGSPTTTSYSDTTTSGTTTYAYVVKAIDGAGNISAPSNTVTITTPDTIPPSVPTGLVAIAASATQINLSWSASSDTGGSGLKGYKLTRNGAALVTTATTATTYSDTGLTASTTYTYAVAAYDGAGNTSGYSTAVNAKTLAPPIGKFQLVSKSNTGIGAAGAIVTALVTNSGAVSITAISVACGGSWLPIASSSSIAPGATGTFQCQENAFGAGAPTMTLTGTNATNSPFAISFP